MAHKGFGELAPSNVAVITDEYRRAHGEEPRGRGHWLFKFGRDTDLVSVKDDNGDGYLLYSVAKRIAKEQAARYCYHVIYVCP